ncbi:MAG: FAD-dependent monooxygenase [Acidiferrobacterales bacterium]|nr:FAD-dependent monooxygenase [Acidiferrobacterales bacterium]
MANVACIGAGTVGRGWAVVFAKAGHQVALYDKIEKEVSERAMPLARTTLELLQQAGFLTESIEVVLSRIRSVSSIKEAVEQADYVQESVREDLEIKRTVFAEIARYALPECLLASSTSAIKGSDFLMDIADPERALVAHPVNPPSLIPLVELCGSQATSDETLERAKSFLINAAMKPVKLNREIDGFILNRLQYTLVAEAMHLVGEGYCSAADIDRVLTDGLALRWASIGPFEVAHLNAVNGFLGFVEHLGPMMKKMGSDARTDYDWGQCLTQDIHKSLEEHTPIDQIQRRQLWRDARILATRKLQQSD